MTSDASSTDTATEAPPAAPAEPFDPTVIKTVAFDGYGTLFNFANTDFHRAITVILAEQKIEMDIDAFFEKWVSSYGKAGVWADESRHLERPGQFGDRDALRFRRRCRLARRLRDHAIVVRRQFSHREG